MVKDHRRRQVAGSRGRQKVIHRGSKKAKVQAAHSQKALFVRQEKTIIHGRIKLQEKQNL